MGDRGHIHLHHGVESGTYIYAHCSGSQLPDYVRQGLERGESRWDDAPYLNRIIFCTLVEDDVKGTTGFGIDDKPCDTGDGHRIVDVDHAEQTVTLRGDYFKPKSYTFAEYAALGAVEWPE